MTNEERNLVKNYIKKLIREEYINGGYGMAENNMGENDMLEKKHKSKKKSEKNKPHMQQKRRAVIDALDTEKTGEGDIKLDVAPYAYALWPDKEKDSARSYFYKCLKGELNDSGIPYEFDDNEINRLYSMLSNNSI